jgi:DNA-binding winged helix-turn-helix (wHTH) protein
MSTGDSVGDRPRILLLGTAPDGHVSGLVDVLWGAGYVVEMRDHADATGRLPVESMEYDVVVLDPRALAPTPAPAADLQDVEIGRLRIDARRRMAYVDESPVRMSARELTLLHHLAAHPDVVFSREALLRAVWGSAWRTEGSVTEYVRRLRILLAPTGIGECIVTRKGFGYSFDSAAVR